MINDDVLRKWINNNPTEENIDRRLCKFKRNILRIKLEFTGIGNRHMSLVSYDDLKRGDRIIYDMDLDINYSSSNSGIRNIPRIFQIVSLVKYGDDHDLGILIGTGKSHIENDYLMVGKTYMIDNLKYYPTVLRLDSMGRYKSNKL
jgi:hypothetical protein